MKKLNNQRGAAAVELAIILPLLVTLLFGIIEAGRYYNAKNTLTHAAREGVRVVALGGTVAAGQARVTATSSGLSGVTSTVTACPVSPSATSDATVVASMPFTFNIPFVSVSASVSSTGVMRCGG